MSRLDKFDEIMESYEIRAGKELGEKAKKALDWIVNKLGPEWKENIDKLDTDAKEAIADTFYALINTYDTEAELEDFSLQVGRYANEWPDQAKCYAETVKQLVELTSERKRKMYEQNRQA